MSKRTKAILGVAAATAAITTTIKIAKEIHAKGYDEKAVKFLKIHGKKLLDEAKKLEKEMVKKAKETRKAEKKAAKKKKATKTSKKKT